MRRDTRPPAVLTSGVYTSTARAARALGVSVSTIKRWVDDGVLPAHRTAGGHRKLFTQALRQRLLDGSLPDPVRDLHQVRRALLAGMTRRAGASRCALLDAYHAGVPIETLADEVVAPVMRTIGQRWETGRADVCIEHRGTGQCLEAIYQIKQAVQARPALANRPLAVGGSPEGDPYLLANLLAEVLLIDAGWDVINLGPNTPLESFEYALATYHPRLLWLSISAPPQPRRQFIRAYAHLYAQAVRSGTAVAIGGRALTPSLRRDLACTMAGDRLRELKQFAATLSYRSPGEMRRAT